MPRVMPLAELHLAVMPVMRRRCSRRNTSATGWRRYGTTLEAQAFCPAASTCATVCWQRRKRASTCAMTCLTPLSSPTAGARLLSLFFKLFFRSSVRDDLLDSTLLAGRRTTLRQHLAAHPSLMLELPPPDLAHRYSG
jgi:hypothetical protein